MYPQQITIYEYALKHFGSRNQVSKCIEEMGELIQVLAKKLQTVDDFTFTDKIIEELADVQIMVHQMSFLFGLKEFTNMVNQKTNRLSMRIGLEMSRDEADKS